MSRRKLFWSLAIIVVLAAAAGGAYFYVNIYSGTQEAEEEPLRTSTVRRGEIVIAASGSGTVVPAAEAELAFQGGGLLVEVLVEVGDRVQAGDVLARIDDSQARKAVLAAELQVVQAEEALADRLDTAQFEQEAALADANLEAAQLKLAELQNWAPDEDAVEQAAASLAAAEADYQKVIARSAYDVTASARISLDQAQQSLVDAQAAYATAWEPARDWELNDSRLGPRLESERDAAVRNLEKAQQNLELARANYNLAWAGVSTSDALNAESKILSAQAALEAAQTGPDESEMLEAEIQVLQAEINLAKAQEALESDTRQLDLSLDQARLNLEIAQQDLDRTALAAPMDGTVMAVSARVGEMVSSTPIITLAAIEQPSVEVFLDETDLTSVGVGFEVEVILDALPDDVFVGHVVQVDPGLVTVSNVKMVRAVVQLDEASYAKPRVLPVGANASVEVIGGRAENALLVPVEALNEYTTGQYAVFVMQNGEPIFTPVTVGLMDYSFAEILAGLEMGDQVTTGIVETQP